MDRLYRDPSVRIVSWLLSIWDISVILLLIFSFYNKTVFAFKAVAIILSFIIGSMKPTKQPPLEMFTI